MTSHELVRLIERSFVWHVVGDVEHQLFRGGFEAVLIAVVVSLIVLAMLRRSR